MNEIIISNIPPQNININEGGVTGITTVYVNGVDVTVGNNAYVLVPTKLSELQNDTHFITQESDPTVPTWVKAISISDINNWNSKQNQLTAGTNIEINDNVISAPLTDYVKFTDYADYGKAGVIKPQSGSGEASLTNYGFGINSNGQPFAYAASSYIGYDRLHFNAFISKETLETAIEGKELTNKTYVDSANTLQDKEISDLKSENDYLNSIINQLPKVSSQGTILTLNNTINGRMNIELGASELTQDGTPTPDSPQDIHTISGSNKVVVCGKNLFNKDNVVQGYLRNSNGTINPEAGSHTSNFIIIEPNTNYVRTTTEGNAYYDKNETFISYYYGKTITTPNNAKYLRMTVIDNKLNDEQLEKGSTATTYTPYVSQEADIDLGDIEYCKIGDYQDYIYKENDNWYLYKTIGKVVFDGTQTWTKRTDIPNLTNTICFRSSYSSAVNSNALANTPQLSNKFVCLNNTTDVEHIRYTGASNYIFQLFINKSRLASEDSTGLNTWLASNNLTIYYVLATPTYTPITGTLAEQLENIYQNLLSYKGQTNISQVNNDLPFTISASALLDLNTLVGE